MNGSTFLVSVSIAFMGVAALATGKDPPDDGESIYLSRCMSCHQVDGGGIAGVFPPLAKTKWVTGDKGVLIRLVLDGIMGEVEVQGLVYSGAMPPWKAFLSDDEIAALLTYIRDAWGNAASAVNSDEVALVREATHQRTQPWTAGELSDAANQGIPGSLEYLLVPPDTTGAP